MKKNRDYRIAVFSFFMVFFLLQGCKDGYTAFSESIITTAYLASFFGIGSIWAIQKLFNIQKARQILSSLSFASKLLSVFLGIISILMILVGFLSKELHFYNTFLGTILLFISHRLYQSAKCWKSGNWEDAKFNSKLIMFSISIFITIAFLIYFGRDIFDF